MLDKEILKKFNNEYIVFYNSSVRDNYEVSLKYSFKNILSIENYDLNNIVEIAKSINNSKIKKVFLLNMHDNYRSLVTKISPKIEINWIFTYDIASLTDNAINSCFKTILEYYDREQIDNIVFTNNELYELMLKKGYKIKNLILDCIISKDNKKTEDSIGLINNDDDPKHSFYNELSAIKLINYKKVNLVANMKATKDFLNFFEIKSDIYNNIDEFIDKNKINLYVNFCNNSIELILKSMDLGIPCLIGNCTIFDKFPILKKYLVLDSDDDINEIANKINNILENKKEILDEYLKFRNEYHKMSEKSIKNILEH